MNQAEKLKDTLNLPKTDFPMRANAVEREPVRLSHWEDQDVYQKMQEKNAGNEDFILHDGPPFTNGDVHVGTALNKTLKGCHFTIQECSGFSYPLCAGMGLSWITNRAQGKQGLRKEKKEFDSLSLRQACQEFSKGLLKPNVLNLRDWEFLQIGVVNTKR